MPSVCVISLTAVMDDPRVRRHCLAFEGAGWEVLTLGYGGGMAEPLPGRTITVDAPQPAPAWRLANAARLAAGRLFAPLVLPAYWTAAERRRLFALARKRPTNLYLANDWNSLPLAFRLARATDAPVVYDSHEYALQLFAESRRWRFIYPPTIRAIEDRYIHRAAGVSTVSGPIARSIAETYALPELPAVVRNLPPYESMPLNVPGERISVLFHGILAPGRGLEPLIDSVPLWQRAFRLTIRGPGPAHYLEALRARIQSLGVGDRVRLDPPAPVTELIGEANKADIGIHCLPDSSDQKRFALPNKIFEYIMAGLALCVTDLPEMGAVVRAHRVGLTIPAVAPQAIAETVNAFTPGSIMEFKRAALRAAHELNWQRECDVLLDLCHAAVFGDGR